MLELFLKSLSRSDTRHDVKREADDCRRSRGCVVLVDFSRSHIAHTWRIFRFDIFEGHLSKRGLFGVFHTKSRGNGVVWQRGVVRRKGDDEGGEKPEDARGFLGAIIGRLVDWA